MGLCNTLFTLASPDLGGVVESTAYWMILFAALLIGTPVLVFLLFFSTIARRKRPPGD